MRRPVSFAALPALILAGCAVLNGEAAKQPVADTRSPFPTTIYVYDFAVSPGEVPQDSAAAAQLSGAVDDPNSNPERAALEQKIAETMSISLVAELQKAGLPAVRWAGKPPKNQGTYIVEGQFLTSDEGSGRKIVGLALDGTSLRVLAQVYRVDDGRKEVFLKVAVGKHGLAGTLPASKLSAAKAARSVSTSGGAVQSVTSKVKKAAEQTAATIVGLLKPKMQKQGWL